MATTPVAAAGRPDIVTPSPEQIMGLMIRVVNLTARPFNREISTRHGITLNEWRCLRVLGEHGGHMPSAASIAELTGLDKMSTSRAVNALERKNFVRRKRSAQDQRRIELMLSAAGRKLVATLVPAANARAAQMLESVSPNSRTQMARTLALIVATDSAESRDNNMATSRSPRPAKRVTLG